MNINSIKRTLPSTVEEIPQKNSLNSYLPLRNKGNDFNWKVVISLFIGSMLRQEIKYCTLDNFVDNCCKAFENKIDSSEFWQILSKMYFENDAFCQISPECLLFAAAKTDICAADKRMSLMYCSLLDGVDFTNKLKIKLNFIEKEIVNVLKLKIIPGGLISKEEPYLPFLSNHFKNDLLFLSSKPKYFLSEVQNFLAIYGFLYCSQLALNIKEWRKGVPTSKPLYFIMDNEKASSERNEIQMFGWKNFHEAANYLFPMLSMLENLQTENKEINKIPLWHLAQLLILEDNVSPYREAIKKFAYAFKEQRKLNTILQESEHVLDWLDNLMLLAVAQFKKNLVDSTRYDINQKYIKELEKQIGVGFIESRGRAGRVLVFNQDNIILLTNIAIGEKGKIRFNELISAFSDRGVFFDKLSQLKLIEFYERIGNVDRMSDSGDAVYVRKTV